jgi:WD40 repeat protein
MAGQAFISYAREDREYVEKLVKFLDDEGVDVWYDEELVTGKRSDEVIQQKIEQCAAFIVVMTPASRESAWVQDELEYARDQGKELMPILLEGAKFFGLGPIQIEILPTREMPTAAFVRALKGLVGEGELRFEMRAHEGHVLSVAYPAAEASIVASAGKEMCVRLWNPATGDLRLELRGASWPVSLSRYGDKIATGGPANTVYIWDTETGELIKTVGEHKAKLTSIALSPDSSLLVTGAGGNDRSERVWEVESGELKYTLGGRVRPASPLVIAPDGTWLIAPTEPQFKRSAGLWSLTTGKLFGTLGGHQGDVHDVTVSWDGRYVATGGDDRTARIWDAKTGDELRFLSGHSMAVRAVAFSRSGYRLATGSTDQTIRLWDATTGAHIKRITNAAGGIYDLAYSPDGKTLASGHGDGAIRIWTA